MSKLRILHINKRCGTDNKGGITVCYNWNKLDSFVDVATAVCSKQDNYNKEVGRDLAIENYKKNQIIRLPYTKSEYLPNPRIFLLDVFRSIAHRNYKGGEFYPNTTGLDDDSWF